VTGIWAATSFACNAFILVCHRFAPQNNAPANIKTKVKIVAIVTFHHIVDTPVILIL
jgi:hypothetical protein